MLEFRDLGPRGDRPVYDLHQELPDEGRVITITPSYLSISVESGEEAHDIKTVFMDRFKKITKILERREIAKKDCMVSANGCQVGEDYYGNPEDALKAIEVSSNPQGMKSADAHFYVNQKGLLFYRVSRARGAMSPRSLEGALGAYESRIAIPRGEVLGLQAQIDLLRLSLGGTLGDDDTVSIRPGLMLRNKETRELSFQDPEVGQHYLVTEENPTVESHVMTFQAFAGRLFSPGVMRPEASAEPTR